MSHDKRNINMSRLECVGLYLQLWMFLGDILGNDLFIFNDQNLDYSLNIHD